MFGRKMAHKLGREMFVRKLGGHKLGHEMFGRRMGGHKLGHKLWLKNGRSRTRSRDVWLKNGRSQTRSRVVWGCGCNTEFFAGTKVIFSYTNRRSQATKYMKLSFALLLRPVRRWFKKALNNT